MSSPSEPQRQAPIGAQKGLPAAAGGLAAVAELANSSGKAPEAGWAPLEFRSLLESELEWDAGLETDSSGTASAGAGGPGERRSDEQRSGERRSGERRVGGRRVGDITGAALGQGPGGPDQIARDAAAAKLLEVARQEGFQAGEREGQRTALSRMQAEMSAGAAQERAKVVKAVSDFAELREKYFCDVEQEVVKLALAIAARVLHREAQMDPLLLSVAVRVALEKMTERSGVTLRAVSGDLAGWERMFSSHDAADRPHLLADERLSPGECVLETKLGTVELGVRAQLEEIEKGFFDLLNHRPSPGPSKAEA